MMEEFRRRRNMKKHYDMMKVIKKEEAFASGKKNPYIEVDEESMQAD